ncbi:MULTISPECIES: hypothetical protein [Nocardiaceae]|uniref:hypothetical protein n=1 Tax=Nocardiaceae TaxID=85025 RepID=UPI0011408C9E|nr:MULTISPECIES: hypothetical protein [Rhodococcus]
MTAPSYATVARAALAPAMVLTMSEIAAAVLRAPRRHRAARLVEAVGTPGTSAAPTWADDAGEAE